MRILKLYADNERNRINYQVDFGVWEEIEGSEIFFSNFNVSILNDYDVILLPKWKRWKRVMGLKDYGYNILNSIKNHKIKKVLLDMDSYWRDFKEPFYEGLDYIFYHFLDKNGNTPTQKSSFLKRSVNTRLYYPKFGGKGVLFNCTANKYYPLRMEIEKIIPNTKFGYSEYIEKIQESAGAIHTDTTYSPYTIGSVFGKALEFSSCGTQIISNRVKEMNYYFPDELITYFDDVKDLKEIVDNFEANIEIQKELRFITETKHDNKIRAQEIIEIIRNL